MFEDPQSLKPLQEVVSPAVAPTFRSFDKFSRPRTVVKRLFVLLPITRGVLGREVEGSVSRLRESRSVGGGIEGRWGVGSISRFLFTGSFLPHGSCGDLVSTREAGEGPRESWRRVINFILKWKGGTR